MRKTIPFDNSAALAQEKGGSAVAQEQYPECCAEPLLFAMRDKYHEFAMPLSVILECLKVAETRGHVPRLPDGWWAELANRYNWRFCLR